MGKKIIWSSDALDQLEDIHFYIFFESKSIKIADKVVNTIFDSTDILKTQPEVYKLDKQKNKNDGSFRVYFVYNYAVSYQVTEENIYILRVRHNAQKPQKHSWKK
ncbi:type II toxin-antitoxin system RelE/ParE family toxin [Flavobacterium johnsoniae]|jgi:plasmid stabilization system protein ParE|uniref:Plasmid stabilization system protein ParE n=2 Tax=Flavobacterium johnsoniae TaxID=986 RepID=A0A1M5P4L3_FLAJO|nr:type II toxin-antitoxin system RelE/ParE family toxin [Flavobacterium johnsoniae]ABQ05514.1 plasmid stabilization system [Flavobacterium johnsoniae UW101]OXE96757.1 plasmid stabilization protein [Flavobacterium johnsoniae UW101]WQG82684.1 type II toxin-antitoxin system RelE/ParE family toxin [Flavobacterium johnsoniae UW101]SHG96761.1 Plasmid stabilization system protein ParE [Flavobacterium johnsoniae]SHL55018.1 Plasmid stabilization system protein ParE [Flavobacterium johnsoniae]